MYRDFKVREAYLLPISDKTLQMIGDSRIRAACTRTGCLLFVQNRMCCQRICGHSLRYCILEVRGVNRTDIERMNRLLENYFPEYKQRKHHDPKAVQARLSYTEWTPDNTSLFYMPQRFGLSRGALPDLKLVEPCGGLLDGWQTYHTGLNDMIAEVPRSAWMSERREFDGLYTTSMGHCVDYQPILFRRADKNKTYKGRADTQLTTQPLPKMNYFTDPEYMDRLIDPLYSYTQRQREALLEAERHSHKTVMPGHSRVDVQIPASGQKAAE